MQREGNIPAVILRYMMYNPRKAWMQLLTPCLQLVKCSCKFHSCPDAGYGYSLFPPKSRGFSYHALPRVQFRLLVDGHKILVFFRRIAETLLQLVTVSLWCAQICKSKFILNRQSPTGMSLYHTAELSTVARQELLANGEEVEKWC